MTVSTTTRRKLGKRVAHLRSRLVYYFSLYLVPAIIVLCSVLAVMFLPERYPSANAQRLEFRHVPDPAAALTPDDALAELKGRAPNPALPVGSPGWLLIGAPGEAGITHPALEIPTRLIQSLSCWNAQGMEALGSSAEPRGPQGSVRNSKQGYSVALDGIALPASILCRVTLSEPGVLSVNLWNTSELVKSNHRYERGTGLLEGGLLTMALFIVVIALTTKTWTYLLLAAWLVGNLRLGAYAMGWDNHWLGHSIPMEWMPLIRQVTVAAYFLLTYTLFTQLFRSAHNASHPRLLRAAQWSGLVLLAGSFLLPYEWFEPLMWATCGFGILIAAFLLAINLYRSPSRFRMWHIVALSMALCVMFSGTLIVLFGRTEFTDIFNGVVALLLSSVTVALAVAERMREDTLERMRAQTELISNYAMTPMGMFTLDSSGVFLRMTHSLEQMLGISMRHSQGGRWTDYFEPQDWIAVASATKAGHEVEIKLLDSAARPGRPQHFVLQATLSGGHIDGSLLDVTARTQTIQRLRSLADNDPLTEVLNRRGIEKAVGQALDDVAKGVPCSLAYLDLEHFKRINGLFGHTAGDEVLKLVCERIQACLTEQQKVGRIGGDEFVILFSGSTAAEAKELATRVSASINTATYNIGARAFQIATAMGVVALHMGMTVKDAISAAAHACRDARKRRRDVMVYEENSLELQEHAEELRLFDQLEGGHSPRGLYLDMQPIMSLHSPMESLNFEALLRVRDSTGSLIPSGKFIASAEENGTITLIDKWVFTATLEWLAKHENRLKNTRFVNVNLSGVSLNDEKFINSLFNVLERYEALCKLLYVEITEGVALQDLDRTRQFMLRLRRMGAHIALDDFGAGYSSFSYLKELPADAIKIDGALIKDMMAHETNKAIVRTISELARNLGMKSIAEWVEDCDTLEALKEMGIDYVQGYAVSKAKPPIDILNAGSILDLVSDPDTRAFIMRQSRE
ncbi:putative bifunctional diguanylate cyclase/phosphodiesterase [Parapusillimonas granuli]|uniref:putative bifunctional diguanylate cyclase/phosphodiesterase n=1 Tax=Parapusillimonas granuli TaxID=380911 RepID=UPI00183B49A8|nr:EAL domain-containing protein [Parapusillimonas granuli]MBB5216272.1 diguanylate cyclase (GGDEF)-like protein [Parapusillimonas granuli]MEB2400546.1 EAL domain-containing protein [Alcaligenaceae bacterium]